MYLVKIANENLEVKKKENEQRRKGIQNLGGGKEKVGGVIVTNQAIKVGKKEKTAIKIE